MLSYAAGQTVREKNYCPGQLPFRTEQCPCPAAYFQACLMPKINIEDKIHAKCRLCVCPVQPFSIFRSFFSRPTHDRE